jgi:uncharacterized protein YgbK (DUF1537 family)
MLLGVIADDFTGASDIAAMLARGGMAVRLLLGIPRGEIGPTDAAVVALKSRSIAAEDAVAQSLAALEALRRAGARQFVFKYCSTFDSTPEGNIGPVAEALARELGASGVVVCPALPENGRTVYQGHLFVRDRLLSESGLEKHPLNPMTDPDIRRWLALQGTVPIGFVPWQIVSQGEAVLRKALLSRPETLVVVDAVTNDDLIAIGRAASDAPLLTGGSGIAMGLPQVYKERGLLATAASAFQPQVGPGVILSGSCSEATRRQVRLYQEQHPSKMVSVSGLMDGAGEREALMAFAETHRNDEPLIYSSADPEEVAVAQTRYGPEKVAGTLERLFGDLAVELRRRGWRRLVSAGGETSGAVVSALGIQECILGPEIAPGVPALLSAGEGAVALALKSGNFGQPEFFEAALATLGRAA